MKKLNRKGFTLIELLAVIVIMAIILVVTLPYIFTAVGDARVSSIHNLSKTAVKAYNDMAAADMLATDKQLSSDKIGMTVNSTWQCMTEKLAEKLGISLADVVIGPSTGTGALTLYGDANKNVTTSYCSAIKLNGGQAEILLVAKDGGKFAEAESYVYALSSDDNGKRNAKPTS